MAAGGRPRAVTRRRVRPWVVAAAALAAAGLLVATRGALAVRPEPGVAEDGGEGEGEGEGEVGLQGATEGLEEVEEAPEEGEAVMPQIPEEEIQRAPSCRRWTAAANAGPESALWPVGMDMEQDLAAGVAVNCSGLSLENARITLEGPWGVKSSESFEPWCSRLRRETNFQQPSTRARAAGGRGAPSSSASATGARGR